MRKINIISAFLYVVIFVQKIYSQELLSLPQDDAELDQANNVQPPSSSSKMPNLVTIDLSECSCTGISSSCDLTIVKSALMDIICKDGESLCCSMTKSVAATADSLAETNSDDDDDEHPAEIAPRSNVRVYSITPTIISDFNSPNSEPSSAIKSKKDKSKKCACKARSSCPHKYIDYGFGFYCTYNTVRCCIPEDAPEQITISVDIDSETVEEQPILSVVNTTVETEVISDSGLMLAANDSSTDIIEMAFNMTTGEINSTSLGEDNDDDTTMLAMTEIENVVEENNASSIPITFNIESNVSTSLVENATTTGGDEVEEEQERQEQTAEAEAGALIITEVTNWSDLEDGDEDEYSREGNCFCLPIQKCRIAGSWDANNMIERRRDTLCPRDLVQCCGSDVLDEITKKRDDVAEEYDVVTPIKSDMPELLPQQASQYPSPSSSDSFLLNNETSMGTQSTAQEIQNLPASSILPAPFPGYQPPGYYKGYGYQHPAKSYLGNGQHGTNNQQYYRNGQQQQLPQNQYGSTGGQSYRPWTYHNYAPDGQTQGGAYPSRNPYEESSRHKSGGLFETLSKYLG